LDPKRGVVCPKCGSATLIKLSKSTNKKIELTLLIHPDWLAPVAKGDANGNPYGGSAQDEAISTALWNETRARQIRLVEVRGTLPETVTCPDTGVLIYTGKAGGTVPKQSTFTCGRCGNPQDVLETVKKSRKTGPLAAYAIQGYAPAPHEAGFAYNGRFFAPFSEPQALQYNAALVEWEARKNQDLANYWPKEELFHYDRGNDSKLYIQPDHGFTHWWMMFNPRQMLVHTQILKAILHSGDYSWPAREYLLGAFQQYLRNQNLFCFWNPQRDTPEPLFSNNNYHPKNPRSSKIACFLN
jgi:putative DNA methylase